MKILVYEYLTGGGMGHELLPHSLVREGDLMVRALVSDLLEIPGVEASVFRDARLAWPGSAHAGGPEIVSIGAWDDLDEKLREAMVGADAVWPIAPETGACLERLCASVLRAGKRLLNSPPDAVRTASSKRATIRVLERAGVPAVPTHTPGALPDGASGPWVVKPDDGVGCEGTRLVRDRDALARLFDSVEASGMVVQPFLEGDAMSLSAVFHCGRATLLSCNRQRVVIEDDRFRWTGCRVDAVDGSMEAYRRVAAMVAAALPELWGYAGVDLIATRQGPRVLEINPRLTTSYAGIRQATGINPAACVLDLVRRGDGVARVEGARGCVEIDLEPAHGD